MTITLYCTANGWVGERGLRFAQVFLFVIAKSIWGAHFYGADAYTKACKAHWFVKRFSIINSRARCGWVGVRRNAQGTRERTS